MSNLSTGASDWEKGSGDLPRAAYSIPEVATSLGVSEATIWRTISRRQLDVVKVGARTLVTANSFRKLAQSDAARAA